MKDVMLDYSQNPFRRAFTNSCGRNYTLTTSTTLYHFGRDRILLPPEYMRMQGWDSTMVVPGDMTATELRVLAGEGMALPCLASVLYGIYLVKGLPEG